MKFSEFDELSQIFEYFEQCKYEEAVEFILGLPDEKRNILIQCHLANAYNNLEKFDLSIATLWEMESEGKEDALWNSCMGYALFYSDKTEEARLYLEKAKKSDPKTDGGDLLFQCMFNGKDFEINQQIFLESLQILVPAKSVIKDNALYIPEWKMSITGRVSAQSMINPAEHHYYINCSLWDREIHEHFMGIGKTAQEAFLSAQMDFADTMLSAVKNIMNNETDHEFEHNFIGKTYNTAVYKSDLQCSNSDIYWNLLGDKIKERLGKSRINFIKIFVFKLNKYILCECKINGLESPELSGILKDYAENQNTPEAKTLHHKQYFFCLHDTAYYPYAKEEMINYVLHVAELFDQLYGTVSDLLDACYHILVKKTGDEILATSLCVFLPEIACMNSFKKMQFAEKVSLNLAGKNLQIYTFQIEDYKRIHESFCTLADQKLISEFAYKKLIEYSTAYKEIQEAQKNGIFLETMTISFNMPNTYLIR